MTSRCRVFPDPMHANEIPPNKGRKHPYHINPLKGQKATRHITCNEALADFKGKYLKVKPLVQ